MKLTKSKLRQIIKEEISRVIKEQVPDWGEGDIPPGAFGAPDPDVLDPDIENDYDAIDFIDERLSSAYKEAGIKREELLDALYKFQGSVADVLGSAMEQAYNRSRADSNMRSWRAAALEYIGRAVGLRIPKFNPKRKAKNELDLRMKSLMRSKLFKNANPSDKATAEAKIRKAMESLERYGGSEMFYEEILDDALGGYGSKLQNSLAAAAGARSTDSWSEALSSWASGDTNYSKWM